MAGLKMENSTRGGVTSIQAGRRDERNITDYRIELSMRDGDNGAIVVIVGNRSTVQPCVKRRADFRSRHEQPQRERQNPRREENSFARATIELK